MKAITGTDHAFKDILSIFLVFQFDLQPIALCDPARGGKRNRIDINAGKGPAIFMLTRQRIDKAGPGPDIQHPDIGALRDLLAMTVRQQIGQIVNVIHAPRNGGAEICGGNLPEPNAVMRLKKRPIQKAHRLGILKIDRPLATRIFRNDCRKIRAGHDQPIKIVSVAMLVARVQHGFDSHGIPFACWRLWSACPTSQPT